MAAARDRDVIRLTLPADADMGAVLAVAVRVVGIRSGLTDDELDSARDRSQQAFDELLDRTRVRTVGAELEIAPTEVWLRLRAGDEERTVGLQLRGD